jgi:hypothetical protein
LRGFDFDGVGVGDPAMWKWNWDGTAREVMCFTQGIDAVEMPLQDYIGFFVGGEMR